MNRFGVLRREIRSRSASDNPLIQEQIPFLPVMFSSFTGALHLIAAKTPYLQGSHRQGQQPIGEAAD